VRASPRHPLALKKAVIPIRKLRPLPAEESPTPRLHFGIDLGQARTLDLRPKREGAYGVIRVPVGAPAGDVKTKGLEGPLSPTSGRNIDTVKLCCPTLFMASRFDAVRTH
jgi:hypothetical protein